MAVQTPNQIAEIAGIKSQLSDLGAQKDALEKYNLSDTSQLIKDNYGNYVPKTPATPVGGTVPGATTSTVKDLYGGVYSPDPNAAALKSAQNAASSGYTAGKPTQTDAYTTALNDYQDQIDAINSLYATKRAEVTKQYTQLENQRLGSEGALLANTGMAGTTFGTSKTAELGIANTNELQSAQDKVDAEKAAAVAQIMGNVRAQASQDYQTKLTAYTSGADKTLQYLKDSATRNDTNATQVSQNAILKGLDLSDPSNFGIVQQIAQTMGVDPSFIIDKYKAAKVSYDESQKKVKQDTDKAAADLAKTIQDTAASKTNEAKTRAEIGKIYSDIANGGTYQSGGLKIGKADLSDIQGLLKNGNQQKGLGGSGQNGYANTTTYVALYNHWIDQGGLAKDFVSNFPPKTYLNPNDPTMPAQLKNAINSSTINVVIPGTGQ